MKHTLNSVLAPFSLPGLFSFFLCIFEQACFCNVNVYSPILRLSYFGKAVFRIYVITWALVFVCSDFKIFIYILTDPVFFWYVFTTLDGIGSAVRLAFFIFQNHLQGNLRKYGTNFSFMWYVYCCQRKTLLRNFSLHWTLDLVPSKACWCNTYGPWLFGWFSSSQTDEQYVMLHKRIWTTTWENGPSYISAKQRFKSTCESKQSEHVLRCSHEENLQPQLSKNASS